MSLGAGQPSKARNSFITLSSIRRAHLGHKTLALSQQARTQSWASSGSRSIMLMAASHGHIKYGTKTIAAQQSSWLNITDHGEARSCHPNKTGPNNGLSMMNNIGPLLLTNFRRGD